LKQKKSKIRKISIEIEILTSLDIKKLKDPQFWYDCLQVCENENVLKLKVKKK